MTTLTVSTTMMDCPHVTDDFKRIFEVNTYGPFYLSRALARSWLSLPISVDGAATDVASLKDVQLNKQLLIVSSISAHVAMYPQRQTAYNASKAAVTMMTKVRGRS
jgi:sorbose reductase